MSGLKGYVLLLQYSGLKGYVLLLQYSGLKGCVLLLQYSVSSLRPEYTAIVAVATPVSRDVQYSCQ